MKGKQLTAQQLDGLRLFEEDVRVVMKEFIYEPNTEDVCLAVEAKLSEVLHRHFDGLLAEVDYMMRAGKMRVNFVNANGKQLYDLEDFVPYLRAW